MPQDYQSQFRAFYDPNLRTEANISLPGVGYGEGSGGGGIDIDSILRTVWRYKQAAANAEAAREQSALEQRAALARDAAEEARRAMTDDRRMMLQASVDGAHALHSTYGGPTPFNPARTVADFYEYGAGNPQGRGGGGSANERAKISDFADEDAVNYADFYQNLRAQRATTPVSAADRTTGRQ